MSDPAMIDHVACFGKIERLKADLAAARLAYHEARQALRNLIEAAKPCRFRSADDVPHRWIDLHERIKEGESVLSSSPATWEREAEAMRRLVKAAQNTLSCSSLCGMCRKGLGGALDALDAAQETP